jgi:glycosyltransferase involved in cell wall biosynthesis
MRIVLDLQSRQSPSRVRGIGRYSLALARNLAKLATGHEVIVALNGALPDHIDDIRADFDGLIPSERIVAWSQPGGVGFVNGDSRWRARAAERLRERFLESLQPDILHVSSLFEGLGDDVSTSIGEVASGLPTAVTLYDLIPMVRRDVYLSNPVVADWYERKLASLRRADLWLAISDHTRREGIDLLGLPEDRVRSISSAVDPMFRPAKPANEQELRRRYGLERPFIMYTATIEPHKNVEGLFVAYGKLPRQIRRAHKLAIVCRIDEHNLARLNAAARRAGLRDDDYVITGYVPDDDLLALYSICRLYVFPSLHEGFGLPALEAMACGAPVIASDSTSLPEVVGRRDALFDAESPEAIAGAMARALGDEGFLKELRAHGRERARLFSWESTARKALDAFEDLHERRRELVWTAVPPAMPRRPRLAFVCPLMPVANRFSRHAALILPELARHYDIECVVEQDVVEDAFARANLPVRSARWFADNGAHYDRVLYHLGDDPDLYSWASPLLRRWPGTVVLHEGHLGDALSKLAPARTEPEEVPPDPWLAELYRSHGWTAVVERLRADDPDDIVAKYPCLGSVVENATGIIAPYSDSDSLVEVAASGFAASGSTHIRADLSPARVAELYRDAIEEHAESSRLARLDRLADDIVAIATPDSPTPADWENVLSCAAENLLPATRTRQLLVDVSELVQRDAGTGIQRVTKNITLKLLENPPAGFRVEPVYDDGTGVFRYARALAAKLIGFTGPGLPDDLIDTQPGDVLLGLDLVAHQIVGRREVNRRLRHRGVRVFYVVYDLLPVRRPEWFPPFPLFRIWLQAIGSEADGLVCISRSVAQQLREQLPELEIRRRTPLKIGHFHLGADIDTGAGTTSDAVRSLLERPRDKFLVVGTVEPRKGHAQCLAAFEMLWAAGIDADLVLVGKQGWMVEDLAERLRTHAEAGKRLHWFEKASDADLSALYEKCTALLAMSQDEGFGLPLIEAAKHGQPIIARDIPVFREIAGDHATYFSGLSEHDFAKALATWIDRHRQGKAPHTATMPWLTWADSADQLIDAIFHERWDATWVPGQAEEVTAQGGMDEPSGIAGESSAVDTGIEVEREPSRLTRHA